MPSKWLPVPTGRNGSIGGHHEAHVDDGFVSRRTLLAGSAALLASGGVGSGITALAAAPETPVSAPPLPWKWVKLDPLEAGRRGYHFYKEKGGCGSASYLSLLSLLKKKSAIPGRRCQTC